MRKIAVAISKGGVGKTTTAVYLAHGLSLQNKKVLLVDTDDQGQCAYTLGVSPEYGLSHVLDEQIECNKAIYQARENLFILAGGSSLSSVKRSIGRKDFAAEQSLSESLKTLDQDFDFVIIDTSPAFDVLTINALFFCQEVLTPVSMEVLAINSLLEFCKRLEQIKKFNSSLTHRYILPTFKDNRVKKTAEILEILHTHYQHKVCEPIRYNSRLSESPGIGKTIFEYEKSSSGAIDYEKLTEKVIKNV